MTKMNVLLGACIALGATQVIANELQITIPTEVEQAIDNAKVINPELKEGVKITACAYAKEKYEMDDKKWSCFVISTNNAQQTFTLATHSLKGFNEVYKITLNVENNGFDTAVAFKYVSDLKSVGKTVLTDVINNNSVSRSSGTGVIGQYLATFSYLKVERL